MVDIGLVVPGAIDPGDLFAVLDAADDSNLHSVWVTDRTIVKGVPWLETFALLGAVAARTRRVQVGNSVLVPARRNPVLTAHALATVDHLSNGRLITGVGIGGLDPREYQIADVPMALRASITDEYISLLRRLWTEDGVTHSGEHYSCEDITLLPKPKSDIPIWIGGSSPGALARAGRCGDGWLPTFVPAEQYGELLGGVHVAAVAAGRDPDRIVPAVYLFGSVAPTTDAATAVLDTALRGLLGTPLDHLAFTCLVGTPDDWMPRIEQYEAAGVRHINVVLFSNHWIRDFGLLAGEVLPGAGSSLAHKEA